MNVLASVNDERAALYDAREDDDLDYWIDRYRNCFPATYPPELWSQVPYEVVIRAGIFGLFRKTETFYRSVCRRCKQSILTFHQCPDISRAFAERRERSEGKMR